MMIHEHEPERESPSSFNTWGSGCLASVSLYLALMGCPKTSGFWDHCLCAELHLEAGWLWSPALSRSFSLSS